MGCNLNWQNEIFARALKKPFSISRHSDSCGDGGSGCNCEPTAGSFNAYTSDGFETVLAWLKEQPWKENFYMYLIERTGQRFGGDDIPESLLAVKYKLTDMILDYIRQNRLY